MIANLALPEYNCRILFHFTIELNLKLHTYCHILEQLVPTCKAEHKGPRRRKQPNAGFRPSNTRSSDNEPSFVIECGADESSTRLRSDACYWLTQTNNRTNVVLLIRINRDQEKIIMERWGRALRYNYRPSRHQKPNPQPICEQTVTVEADGTVKGAPLILPVDLIFDTLPRGMPNTEFQFSQQELSSWAMKFWKYLRDSQYVY